MDDLYIIVGTATYSTTKGKGRDFVAHARIFTGDEVDAELDNLQRRASGHSIERTHQEYTYRVMRVTPTS